MQIIIKEKSENLNIKSNQIIELESTLKNLYLNQEDFNRDKQNLLEEISTLNLQIKNLNEEIVEINNRNRTEMDKVNLKLLEDETKIEKNLLENAMLNKELEVLTLKLQKIESLNLELELKDKNQQILEFEKKREFLQEELIESHKSYKDVIKNQEEVISELVTFSKIYYLL